MLDHYNLEIIREFLNVVMQPLLNAYQSYFISKIANASAFHLPVFNGSRKSSRCNRKTASAAMSSFKHVQISPVATEMQEVQH
jgi:hypothetical protein